MRILKKRGIYLEEQAKLNRNVSIVFFVVGISGIIYLSSLHTLYFLHPVYYIFAIILGASWFSFRNYINYSSGLEAEKLVIGVLQNLDDRYYLINDVKLPNSYGNIDHIVLGANGIFVIETKNFEGKIRCEGDTWYQSKESWKIVEKIEIKSPSKQVKGNALKLKQFIESQKILKKPKLWVEGIVVFTNPNVGLELNNPTVPVLKIEELYNFIKNKKSEIKFSREELELIGKIILM